MVWKVILLAVRAALASTFLYAGMLKIWDFKHGQPATPDFVISIQQYHLLPWPDVTVLLAVYLPWLEVFAAAGLFVRRVRLGSSLTIAILTTIFIGALASAWARGLRIDCGCFGRDEVSTDFPNLLLRDACILAAALVLFVRDARAQTAGASPATADDGGFTLPSQ